MARKTAIILTPSRFDLWLFAAEENRLVVFEKRAKFCFNAVMWGGRDCRRSKACLSPGPSVAIRQKIWPIVRPTRAELSLRFQMPTSWSGEVSDTLRDAGDDPLPTFLENVRPLATKGKFWGVRFFKGKMASSRETHANLGRENAILNKIHSKVHKLKIKLFDVTKLFPSLVKIWNKKHLFLSCQVDTLLSLSDL